jgi:hypothetical protein
MKLSMRVIKSHVVRDVWGGGVKATAPFIVNFGMKEDE